MAIDPWALLGNMAGWVLLGLLGLVVLVVAVGLVKGLAGMFRLAKKKPADGGVIFRGR